MAPPVRKSFRARPLADLVGAAMDPLVAKQGFGEADVILNWDDIVGERLAAVTEPQRLQWPPRPPGRAPDAPPEPAALVVRVEGAFALELQHLAPLVVERVNARLGWRCVGRLLLKQGPVRHAAKRRQPPPPVTPEARSRAATAAAGVEDDALRQALERLGAAALTDAAHRSAAKR